MGRNYHIIVNTVKRLFALPEIQERFADFDHFLKVLQQVADDFDKPDVANLNSLDVAGGISRHEAIIIGGTLGLDLKTFKESFLQILQSTAMLGYGDKFRDDTAIEAELTNVRQKAESYIEPLRPQIAPPAQPAANTPSSPSPSEAAARDQTPLQHTQQPPAEPPEKKQPRPRRTSEEIAADRARIEAKKVTRRVNKERILAEKTRRAKERLEARAAAYIAWIRSLKPRGNEEKAAENARIQAAAAALAERNALIKKRADSDLRHQYATEDDVDGGLGTKKHRPKIDEEMFVAQLDELIDYALEKKPYGIGRTIVLAKFMQLLEDRFGFRNSRDLADAVISVNPDSEYIAKDIQSAIFNKCGALKSNAAKALPMTDEEMNKPAITPGKGFDPKMAEMITRLALPPLPENNEGLEDPHIERREKCMAFLKPELFEVPKAVESEHKSAAMIAARAAHISWGTRAKKPGPDTPGRAAG